MGLPEKQTNKEFSQQTLHWYQSFSKELKSINNLMHIELKRGNPLDCTPRNLTFTQVFRHKELIYINLQRSRLQNCLYPPCT